MCKFTTHITVQPKTTVPSVGFNVRVGLFSMNWTSGEAAVEGGVSWPLVPEVKSTLIGNQSDARVPRGGGAIFHLRHNLWHLSTCDVSLPPSHPVFPISEVAFPPPLLNPGRHNKLTCPWYRAKDITLYHITLFSLKRSENVFISNLLLTPFGHLTGLIVCYALWQISY